MKKSTKDKTPPFSKSETSLKSTDCLKKSILSHLRLTLARHLKNASKQEIWMATCYAVRDQVIDRFIRTQEKHSEAKTRRVYYLSLEYLMGRLLNSNLCNAGVLSEAKTVLSDLGYDLDELFDEENDMGLGNGGLGRLAACFLDSMATMDLPAIGYGIHYQFGLFRQSFENGRQVEKPDDWLREGNPWEIARPQYAQRIKLYGHVEHAYDDLGNYRPQWTGFKEIEGIPYDLAIVGYETDTVNFLRLWESKSSQELDLQVFNQGGYVEAVREKAMGETISKVLYPNDETESGKELRLVQQYFFVSCSLQDLIRRFKREHNEWKEFPKKVVIQLNDTHPAVAVLELLRFLLDEEGMSWEEAWILVRNSFAYTNHTLLPEALETWGEELFGKVLPRHLQLVQEINRRFQEEIRTRFPGDEDRVQRMSIVVDGQIKMAYLSVVASRSVNGVAALHTQLLTQRLMSDFAEIYPDRFNNKTNGITPRRWLLGCNPKLAGLIDDVVDSGWMTDLSKLRDLEKVAKDPAFQEKFMSIKLQNKKLLADLINKKMGIQIDTGAIFDSQIKRLHEYKRQHLNLLHILTLYRRLLQDPGSEINKRVFIFGAKAAPGYHLAKVVIHAINLVAKKINSDTRIRDQIKVIFWPNYGVSAAEKIIPASDLSEQISTAGKEASGTGNMKFALNGALTVGTLDGANVEIKEEVGEENIFIFGHTVDGIQNLRDQGYDPRSYYEKDDELKAVIDWLASDYFSPQEGAVLEDLSKSLLDWGDPYYVLADYRSYIATQEKINSIYSDQGKWSEMAILNVAGSGKFSSDRTIGQYAKEIWKLDPVI